MKRNLDNCYFRVNRNNKWENICFSDLTNNEREEVCKNRSSEWFKSLAFHLADCLRDIGKLFDEELGDIEK